MYNKPEFRNIISEHISTKKIQENIGFNFFKVISNTFYKENFHSDILKNLLEIEEFYTEFIRVIASKNSSEIFNFKFQSSSILRENGRIDVTIIDKNIKEVIIIENKINNATDTNRQLPKYYDYWINNGYNVRLIVYLTFSGIKNPNQSTWSDEDRRNVLNIICNLSAIKTKDNYSLTNILENVVLKNSNIDHIVFFKQYINLLNSLSKDEINFENMEKYYHELQSEENFKNAKAFAELFYELPKFRARKVIETFKLNCYPFQSVEKYKDDISYFNNLVIGDSNFAMDIYCEENKYEITFFDRNSNDNISTLKLSESKKLGFYPEDESNRLIKKFSFPKEEKEFYTFISETLEKLK